MNNGGGRDTYISQNDGGFRPMHRSSPGKTTYFNQLRHYPEIESSISFSPRSLNLGLSAKKIYSAKFNRKMTLVHNYQHMMDARLSQPKAKDVLLSLSQYSNSKRQKYFKNSNPDIQNAHQKKTFYRTGRVSLPSNESIDINKAGQRKSMNGSREFSLIYKTF